MKVILLIGIIYFFLLSNIELKINKKNENKKQKENKIRKINKNKEDDLNKKYGNTLKFAESLFIDNCNKKFLN
jgi:hypothetical protein